MVKSFIILVIKLYQNVWSKHSPSVCRFYPSCSHYAIEALEKQGVFKGSFTALKRISKCHPFHPGGIDKLGESS